MSSRLPPHCFCCGLSPCKKSHLICNIPPDALEEAEDAMIYDGCEWILQSGVWWAFVDGKWWSWQRKRKRLVVEQICVILIKFMLCLGYYFFINKIIYFWHRKNKLTDACGEKKRKHSLYASWLHVTGCDADASKSFGEAKCSAAE